MAVPITWEMPTERCQPPTMATAARSTPYPNW